MLIIEGSDHLGKTTAARTIESMCRERAKHAIQQFPIRYEHMTRPNEAFDFFNDYRDMISKYAIMDRFHLGGLVWHDNVISPGSLRIIEGWLLSVGSVIVVFYTRDEKTYREKLEDTKQMFDVETILKANRRYIELLEADRYYIPYHDFIWEVDWNRDPTYPSDYFLEEWTKQWFGRLSHVNRRTNSRI